MIKIIKHGNTFHVYKCPKCGCIFTASKRDIENEDFNDLLHCPECGNLVSDTGIIVNQEITKDKLFEKVNVPSSYKIEGHNEEYEVAYTSATTDDCIKRYL